MIELLGQEQVLGALDKADFSADRKMPVDYAPEGSKSQLVILDVLRKGKMGVTVDIGKDEYIPKVGVHSEL